MASKLFVKNCFLNSLTETIFAKSTMPTTIETPAFQEVQPIGWSKPTVEEFASMLAEKVQFEPGGNIENVVQKLGGEIIYQHSNEWFDSENGSIEIHAPKRFRIHLSNFTSHLRDRFTIAHELGHYVIHSQFGKIPAKIARHGSNRIEWEANWFAAGFLMPEASFKKAWRSQKNIFEVAAQFNVSLQAAEVRRQSLGLV